MAPKKQKPGDELPRFVTPTQLADSIQMTYRYVMMAIESGALKADKIGGRWRIDVREANAWVASIRKAA